MSLADCRAEVAKMAEQQATVSSSGETRVSVSGCKEGAATARTAARVSCDRRPRQHGPRPLRPGPASCAAQALPNLPWLVPAVMSRKGQTCSGSRRDFPQASMTSSVETTEIGAFSLRCMRSQISREVEHRLEGPPPRQQSRDCLRSPPYRVDQDQARGGGGEAGVAHM